MSGIKKFHNFLYDHHPLSFLFNEAKGIPQMVSSCIQRWAITLSAYNYTICYKKGKTLCNADALSRLPRQSPQPLIIHAQNWLTLYNTCPPLVFQHCILRTGPQRILSSPRCGDLFSLVGQTTSQKFHASLTFLGRVN